MLAVVIAFVFTQVFHIDASSSYLTIAPSRDFALGGSSVAITASAANGQIESVRIGESLCENLLDVSISLRDISLETNETIAFMPDNGSTTDFVQARCEVSRVFSSFSAGARVEDVTVFFSSGINETIRAGFIYCAEMAAPQIARVVPQYGLVSGGELLTIVGEYLGEIQHDLLSVMLGNSPCQNITVYNASTITCVTPPSAVATSVRVSVTTWCGQLSPTTNVSFSYIQLPPPSIGVTAVEPALGPNRGNTQVTLKGYGFRNFGRLMKCRFGRVTSPARIVAHYGKPVNVFDHTEMVCDVPPLCGEGPLCHSQCDVSWASCVSSCRSSSLNSTLASSSDTWVWDASNSTFNNDSVLLCTSSCEDSMLSCVGVCDNVPLCLELMNVTLSVEFALNGKDFTSNNVQYTYHANLAIASVSPPKGPLSGGTLVTLTLQNFLFVSRSQSGLTPMCRFEIPVTSNRTSTGHLGPQQHTVPAHSIFWSDVGESIEAITCATPEVNATGSMFVTASLNGYDWSVVTEFAMFRFHDAWFDFGALGMPPSRRWLHSLTQISTDMFVFGGFGIVNGEMQMRGADLLGDMYQLRTDLSKGSSTDSSVEWIKLDASVISGTFPEPRAQHASFRIGRNLVGIWGGIANDNVTTVLHHLRYIEGLEVVTEEVQRDVVRNPYRFPEGEIDTFTNHWRVIDTRTDNYVKQHTIRIRDDVGTYQQPPASGGIDVQQNRSISTEKFQLRGTTSNSVHILDTVSWAWIDGVTQTGSIPHPRLGHTITSFENSEVTTAYLFGGWSLVECSKHPLYQKPQTLPCESTYNDLYRVSIDLDTLLLTWQALTPHGETPTPRYGHTANHVVLNNSSYILVFGGTDMSWEWGALSNATLTGHDMSDVVLYDIANNSWVRSLSPNSNMPPGRTFHTATLTASTSNSSSAMLVVIGGAHQAGWLNDTYEMHIVPSVCKVTADVAASNRLCIPVPPHPQCAYVWQSEMQLWILNSTANTTDSEYSTMNSTVTTSHNVTSLNVTTTTTTTTATTTTIPTTTNDTIDCAAVTFCCPADTSLVVAPIGFCSDTELLTSEVCYRTFWKRVVTESKQTPGVRAGHVAGIVGDEVVIFGGASATLQPVTLHGLTLEESDLVVKGGEMVEESWLLSMFPASTDYHAHFAIDTSFLFSRWDPDFGTACHATSNSTLDTTGSFNASTDPTFSFIGSDNSTILEDTRWHCEAVRPKPAGGASNVVTFEMFDVTSWHGIDLPDIEQNYMATQLTASLEGTRVTATQDRGILESPYNYFVYNPED